MARVTVEDCVKKVENRFELVVLTAERAKRISSGAPITVDRDNDKDAVVALREIAAGHVSIDSLRESLISRLQKHNKLDELDEEEEVQLDEDLSSDDFEYISDDSSFFSEDEQDGSMDESDFSNIDEDDFEKNK